MIDFNYAKAGETEGWLDTVCVDVETNCMVRAAEVNCAEGWAIIMARALGGRRYFYVETRGQFRLMRIAAAKKLGVKML